MTSSSQVEVFDVGHWIKSTKILIFVVLRYYLYFFGILILFSIIFDVGHWIKSTKILIFVILRYYLYFFGILILFSIIVWRALFYFLLLF